MKKISILKLSAISLLTLILSSCLKSDLPELPAYTDALITNVYFEARYKDPSTLSFDGQPLVRYVRLNVTKTIDNDAATIDVKITVPAASGPFTQEIRDKVLLSNIVCSCDLSEAAKITPVGNSPLLGKPGDFSAPRKYTVTAASGSKKEWTITVSAFNK